MQIFCNFFSFFLLKCAWCVSLRGLTTAQSRGRQNGDPFAARPLHRREHQTGDDRAIGGAVCITIDRLIGGVNLPKHRPPHRIGGGGGSDGGNVGAFRAFSGVFSVKTLFCTYIDGKRQKRGNYGALLGASMYIVKPIQKNTGGGRRRNPRPYRWGCIVKD